MSIDLILHKVEDSTKSRPIMQEDNVAFCAQREPWFQNDMTWIIAAVDDFVLISWIPSQYSHRL